MGETLFSREKRVSPIAPFRKKNGFEGLMILFAYIIYEIYKNDISCGIFTEIFLQTEAIQINFTVAAVKACDSMCGSVSTVDMR